MKNNNVQNYLYGLATDTKNGFLPALLKGFLFILSLFYGAVVSVLIFIKGVNKTHLGCKVISIGNITVGGTGKTTLVEYIASYLKSQGKKVAILTRGYKRGATSLPHQASSVKNMGDEPMMLAKNLDGVFVVVDANRIRGAKKAIHDYQADTVVLDDGFQQWKVKKDLEIVTIDATDPFGNRHLLPRGLLREPLSSLKRAEIIFLTKTNLNPDIVEVKDYLSALNPKAMIVEAQHTPLGVYKFGESNLVQSLDNIKDKTVVLLSGIGDPDSFENLVSSLGVKVAASFRFADHHNYTQEQLNQVVKDSLSKNADAILTTEKDAVRLDSLDLKIYDLQLMVLRIKLKIANDEQRFHNRLLRIYTA